MRRYLGFLSLAVFVLACSISANATPLYPDVMINNQTYFSYDASTGVLTMMHPLFSSITGDTGAGGIDSKITYGPGSDQSDVLSADFGPPINLYWLTICDLSITIDTSTGKFKSGTMEEKFHSGSGSNLTLSHYPGGSITLNPGTTLLYGTVTGFSVDIGGTGFTILVDLPTSGAGVWAEGGTDVNGKKFNPVFPKFSGPDLVIKGYLEQSGIWEPDWYKHSFKYDPSTGAGGRRVKSDKYPTPEPTTLLLLGTGIAGIAGVVARRRKRR